jgi:phosphoserine phosphatase
VSAGQGPLLHLVASTGRVEPRNANAVPLGFFPDVRWPEPERVSLAPGDLMAIVTDGFHEWESPSGEAYGIHRVADVVRLHSEAPASAIIERLHAELRQFVGDAYQPDDLTALIIKRLPA